MNMIDAMQENAMRVFDQKTRHLARDARSQSFPATNKTISNEEISPRVATAYASHDPLRDRRLEQLAADLKTLAT